MPMSYNKLFKLMKKRKLTTYQIRKEKIISEGTLQKLRKSESVTTEALSRLCEVLNCQPSDIMEYIPDSDIEKEKYEQVTN